MGTDLSSDELNVVKTKGQHFGFPFCHQGDVPDPVYGVNRSCDQFTPPALKLGAHMAPVGMKFYTGNMFPKEYKNSMLIAQKGILEPRPQAGRQRDLRDAWCEGQCHQTCVRRRLP